MSIISVVIIHGLLTADVSAEEIEFPATLQEKISEGGLIWPPYVVGGLSIEIFSDHTFKADDPIDEISDTFTEMNAAFTVLFTDELYLETDFSFLPVGETTPGEDLFFEAHGLELNTLALTYDRRSFWVSGGRGKANFGIAQSAAAGIWGGDFANSLYVVNDRLGVAGTINLNTETAGNHSVYFGTYFLDTSDLSRTWITPTDPNRLEDGGPSNTESLKSYVLAVDGAGIPKLSGFRYHLAGLLQTTERLNDINGEPLPSNQVDDEYRFAAAGEWSSIRLSENITLTILAEYVCFWNARGVPDDTEDHLTTSLEFFAGQWNVAIAGTRIWLDDSDGTVSDVEQAETSIGYQFQNGIKIDAGYRYQELTGDESHTVGLAFSYYLPFAF